MGVASVSRSAHGRPTTLADYGTWLMEARYRFAVTIRIEPRVDGVSVSPAEFETALYYRAAIPENAGWRFFRDNLWRGELNAPADFRERTADALAVPVAGVEFRVLETDEEYLDALRAAIADNLDEFNAETVDEVLTKYLGSKIRIFEGEPPEF